jgi:hypothetical protein
LASVARVGGATGEIELSQKAVKVNNTLSLRFILTRLKTIWLYGLTEWGQGTNLTWSYIQLQEAY